MAAFVSSGLVAAPSRRAAAATAAARRCACRGRPAGTPAGGPSRRVVVAVPTALAGEPPQTEALVGSSDRAAELPWKTSVAGEEFPLLFMDFIVHMLGVMKGELTGLEDLPFEESLSLQTGKKRVRFGGVYTWEGLWPLRVGVKRRRGGGGGAATLTVVGRGIRVPCGSGFLSAHFAALQGRTPECGDFQGDSGCTVLTVCARCAFGSDVIDGHSALLRCPCPGTFFFFSPPFPSFPTAARAD